MEITPCIVSGSPIPGISNSLLASNSLGIVGVPFAVTGQVLVSNGVASLPSFSAIPKFSTWGSLVNPAINDFAHILDTDNLFSGAGNRLLDIRNQGTSKCSFDKDGAFINNADVNTGVYIIKNSSRLGIQGLTEIRLNTLTLTMQGVNTIDWSSASGLISSGAQNLTISNNSTQQKFDFGQSVNNPNVKYTTNSNGLSVTDRRAVEIAHTINTTVGGIVDSALYVGVTDSRAALAGDVGGLFVDVSAGSNASSTRFGARLKGGPLQLYNGIATDPVAVADMAQVWAKDLSAGNATLALTTETGVVADVGLASTHSLTIFINGSKYKLMLVNVP